MLTAVNGISSVDVQGGLEAGAYRVCTIMCKQCNLTTGSRADGSQLESRFGHYACRAAWRREHLQVRLGQVSSL